MSRIFEALHKANLERKNGQSVLGDVVVNPIVALGIADPFPPKPTNLPEGITTHAWKPSDAALPILAEHGVPVEQLRRLRSRLYQLRSDSTLKSILISSGMPEEGKSFVAANLAITMAHKGGNRILLVDGDLRRPSLHSLLGAPDTPGLAEYLAGSASLHEILQQNSREILVAGSRKANLANLFFISAGRSGDNSSELVAHPRFEEMMTALAERFDWILIDSPPVLVVTDAVDLARAADGVLLVARAARTSYDVARRAQAAFSKSRILGFVLNDVKDAPGAAYEYYSGQQVD